MNRLDLVNNVLQHALSEKKKKFYVVKTISVNDVSRITN